MKYFFGIRGIKHDTDRFINELSAKYLPYKTDKGSYALQLNVQPIQLYCVGFPKEHLQTVLQTIGGGCYHSSVKFMSGVLRKLLRLKKVPKFDDAVKPLPLFRPSAEIVPIGILEDGTFETGQFEGGEAI